MNRLLFPSSVCFVALSVGPVHGANIDCGSKLVREGLTLDEIRGFCGWPDKVSGGRWSYKIREGRSVRTLTFRYGKVVAISDAVVRDTARRPPSSRVTRVRAPPRRGRYGRFQMCSYDTGLGVKQFRHRGACPDKNDTSRLRECERESDHGNDVFVRKYWHRGPCPDDC